MHTIGQIDQKLFNRKPYFLCGVGIVYFQIFRIFETQGIWTRKNPRTLLSKSIPHATIHPSSNITTLKAIDPKGVM